MQRALQLIYPHQCISCATLVDTGYSLCGDCWRETPFIAGLVCDACGTPLPGETDGAVEFCDDCTVILRPWHRGRAALIYKGNARKMVLALKHGDRQELAIPAARWMYASAQSIIDRDTVIVPVPAHWTRLLRRRYNQAVLLARELGKLGGLKVLPTALVRQRHTPVQDGKGRDARFRNVADAIAPHPRRGAALGGKRVLIVDDVMTSGATLSAATQACHAAGATQVCVVALARVAKDA